jgi:hypothetical protein
MRRLSALLCLALLLRLTPAIAQTEIHRCIGANGSAVFTDQPCAALQATPVSPVSTSNSSTPPTAPPPILCAANRGELRQSVIDAFTRHDANRLAGLMLWDGYGHGAAITDIRALTELMKQPLLDIDTPEAPIAATSAPATAFIDDPFAADTPPAPPPANDRLVLHTAGNDGDGSPHELRLDIVRQAGCLWLREAN